MNVLTAYLKKNEQKASLASKGLRVSVSHKINVTQITGSRDHDQLNNLDYERSGHTGFASEASLNDVAGALGELREQIEGITGGGGVTGVKGEAEETYRKGQVNITKANVGLGNVDNTADADKPVSTVQKAALEELAKRISDLPPWGNMVFYTDASGAPRYKVYKQTAETAQGAASPDEND